MKPHRDIYFVKKKKKERGIRHYNIIAKNTSVLHSTCVCVHDIDILRNIPIQYFDVLGG